MATRPDMLVEVNDLIYVLSYTPDASYHMARVWGVGNTDTQGYTRWQIDAALLDPLIHGAAMAGLLIVVRKVRES